MNSQDWLEPFDADGRIKQEVAEANRLLEEFRNKFPFRQNTLSIDGIKPEDLWEKEAGVRDSFFYWLQYKLRESGHLYIGSKIVFENAIAKIEEFKRLLKIALDDGKTISEKIDAPWTNIKSFGGDRHIAKKIVHCYYPERVIPVFKTEELEHFCREIGGIQEGDIGEESLTKFGKSYESLSIGQKWQVLNTLLLNLKQKHEIMKTWDNVYFVRYLYFSFKSGIPPRATETTTLSEAATTPLNEWGLLFVPRNHEEIMYLFSVLHREIGFPYIVSMGQPYPDVTAINDKGETKTLEIELFASLFNHDPKGCDYIICWENDMEEQPPNYPEIIALKDYL